jgi:hypothetical protein
MQQGNNKNILDLAAEMYQSYSLRMTLGQLKQVALI